MTNVELSARLQRLEAFLSSDTVDDDAMLLSELDGFLAGVIVCPDLIMPSEWLPEIWGNEEPVFESLEQFQEISGLIMGHYNDIARRLDRRAYRPIYDVDLDDTLLWEFWIEGFRKAMSLRPDAWLELMDNDDRDLQTALFILGRLGDMAVAPDEIEPLDLDDELEEQAADLIPGQVEFLHAFRLAQAAAGPLPANENRAKVGRNDPCPCGSGKKYKKCCLNKDAPN